LFVLLTQTCGAFTVNVVSHRSHRRKKIRLGLLVAGLVAAGSASLPTVLGPDASATQPPPFVTDPTTTAKPTKPANPPAPAPTTAAAQPTAGTTATSIPVPTPTGTASDDAKPAVASPSAGNCGNDYTDNNWCPKG
jgi:hypothetical protein